MTGRLVLLVLVALLVSGVSEPMLTVPLGWWSLTLVTALPRQRVLPREAREPVVTTIGVLTREPRSLLPLTGRHPVT